MKKIERIEHEDGDTCLIYKETVVVKIYQLDHLESTIDKLVRLLINSTIDCINTNYAEISPRWLLSKTKKDVLKMAEDMERETISYLETLTGKTWEEMKGKEDEEDREIYT